MHGQDVRQPARLIVLFQGPLDLFHDRLTEGLDNLQQGGNALHQSLGHGVAIGPHRNETDSSGENRYGLAGGDHPDAVQALQQHLTAPLGEPQHLTDAADRADARQLFAAAQGIHRQHRHHPEQAIRRQGFLHRRQQRLVDEQGEYHVREDHLVVKGINGQNRRNEIQRLLRHGVLPRKRMMAQFRGQCRVHAPPFQRITTVRNLSRNGKDCFFSRLECNCRQKRSPVAPLAGRSASPAAQPRLASKLSASSSRASRLGSAAKPARCSRPS